MNAVYRKTPYKPSAAGAALHGRLFIADLHADPLLWNRDLNERAAFGHIDVPRLLGLSLDKAKPILLRGGKGRAGARPWRRLLREARLAQRDWRRKRGCEPCAITKLAAHVRTLRDGCGRGQNRPAFWEEKLPLVETGRLRLPVLQEAL